MVCGHGFVHMHWCLRSSAFVLLSYFLFARPSRAVTDYAICASLLHKDNPDIRIYKTCIVVGPALETEGAVDAAFSRLVRWFKHGFFSWTNAPRWARGARISGYIHSFCP